MRSKKWSPWLKLILVLVLAFPAYKIGRIAIWMGKMLLYTNASEYQLEAGDFKQRLLSRKETSACKSFGQPIISSQILDIEESSGLALGQGGAEPYLYTTNDSRNEGLVQSYGLDGLGLSLQRPLGDMVDIESLDQGPCGKHRCIYVADTGSNFSTRTHLEIHRYREGASKFLESLKLDFDGMFPPNIEAMAVEPKSGDIFLLTKGREAELYHIPASVIWPSELSLKPISVLPIGSATGASFDQSGHYLYVISYEKLFRIPWPPPKSGAVLEDLPLAPLPNIEAVQVLANGSLVYTSENVPFRKGLKNLAGLPCLN